MTPRAKFKVTEVNLNESGATIKMAAVTTSNPENAEFFKWTPTGSLQMCIINPEVAKTFNPGDEFFLDFILAPKHNENI